MIPRLLHQTAKTSELPPREREFQKLLIALHPDWKYHLWTDADNDAFVRGEYPDFYDTFVKLPKNIMRADVIRYLLMYKVGGLYMDTDYEMLKPFDLTDHDIVLMFESDGEWGPGNDMICNSIFASEPGHPFFKMCIDNLKANPPLGAGVHVETATGPIFVTRIYRQALQRGMTPYAAPRALFSPPTPRTPREYNAIVNGGVAYGIHHCHGTWRQFTLGQKIKMGLGKLVRRFS